MNRIHRKTSKGQAEIQTRAHGLPPRMRSALILVDGQRTDADIVRMLGSAAAEQLVELAWQNYIERVDPGSIVDTRPLPVLVVPPAELLGTPASAPAEPTDDTALAEQRLRASRELTARLGPFAQVLAQRIEASTSESEFAGLVDRATSLVEGMLGEDAAESFRESLAPR